MNNFKKTWVWILIAGISLYSCNSNPAEKDSSDTSISIKKPVDSLAKISSVNEDSFAGRPLTFYLNSKEIPEFAKGVYYGKIEPNNDPGAFNLPDSLFSKNNNTRPFYFLAVTKSMIKSDGAYSEILGERAKEFAETNTIEFLKYFSEEHLLTSQDFDNWATYIAEEIMESAEHKEIAAMKETMKIMQDHADGCTSEENKTLDRFFVLLRKYVVKYS
jgi:hypothetical protein